MSVKIYKRDFDCHVLIHASMTKPALCAGFDFWTGLESVPTSDGAVTKGIITTVSKTKEPHNGEALHTDCKGQLSNFYVVGC